MGFHSFNTDDTLESIPNVFQSAREVFPVYMSDTKGNIYTENEYEGYGVFGGVDIYELLAEMNGLKISRDEAIGLWFQGGPKKRSFILPALYRHKDSTMLGTMTICEYQGYFYESIA